MVPKLYSVYFTIQIIFHLNFARLGCALICFPPITQKKQRSPWRKFLLWAMGNTLQKGSISPYSRKWQKEKTFPPLSPITRDCFIFITGQGSTLESIVQQPICAQCIVHLSPYYWSQVCSPFKPTKQLLHINMPEFGIRIPLDGIFPEKSSLLFDYPHLFHVSFTLGIKLSYIRFSARLIGSV